MKDEFNKTEAEQVFELYKKTHVLKNTIRSGWLLWGVSNARLESIAEHVFGCCMLAMSLFATKKLDLDIGKVFTMLAIHETEEILIGDITPFDDQSLRSSKKEIGKNAVDKVFEGYPNKQYFLDLIQEFEDRNTKEAKFAFYIDKFEADLQAYMYDGHFDESKFGDKNAKDERIRELQERGFNKVPQYFLQHDKRFFDEGFQPFIDLLEELESV